ncbi:polyadenylate-binding protein 2-like [Sycon ciliatum]|uniref:polyadenylate-binding protein 2-like n=1 Tax=Sycon ciliatum TaxID=27933 RepID=UPI0020AB4EA6|eukprot:scpid75932/ scgid25086/ Polyadenylate-binding protein 2; Nuclear poly(A)-binding protein 1; Poly(A)-binding protein II; Polyadenylate-binding nuclear protein 1
MSDEVLTPTEEALSFEGDVSETGLDADTPADDSLAEDPELELIKARVKEMEEEAEKLKEMQNQVDKQMMSPKTAGTPTAASFPTPEEKADADARSVYVGNVDYGATAEELEEHFHGCGSVNRVTIMCDKFSGHPKGFAYIEFAERDSVTTAVAMDESLFRGRQIKVSAKRTNLPGLSERGRGRGRGRGGYAPRGGAPPAGITGYRMVPVYGSPRGRGRYRGSRGRGMNWYSPY